MAKLLGRKYVRQPDDYAWEGGIEMKSAYTEIKGARNNGERESKDFDKSNSRFPSSQDGDFFHLIAENARDIIFHSTVSPTYRFDYVSPSSTYITGYTPEEFYADPLLAKKCIHPDDFHLIADPSIWDNPRKNEPVDIRWKCKDGRMIWTQHMITLTRDKHGKPEAFQIIARDVTERKKAEAALRESQQFNASLLEHAPHAAVVINPDTSVKYVNPAWERLNGWTFAEVVGTKVPYPWWPSQFKDAFTDGFKEAMKQGSGKAEIIAQKKSGELYWIDMNWASVMNNGELAYLLINSVDITERKRMESALRESEEKFAVAFRAGPQMMTISNRKTGKFIDVNDSYVNTTGYSREEFIGHSGNEKDMWVNPEELKRMLRLMQEQEKIRNEEFSLRMKSGEIRNWLCSADTINIGGESCSIAVATDITERKRMEKALRESEEKFSKAFHAMPEAVSISRLKDGIFLDVNDSFLKTNGYTREEVIGHTANEINLWVKSDERDRIVRLMNERGTVKNEEFEFQIKSGETRTALLSGDTINIGGEPCVILIGNDITQQKQAEEQLRLLSSVTRQVSDSTIITDPDFNITYMNQAAQDLFGYNIDELKGKSIAIFNKTPISAEDIESIRKTLAAGKVYSSTATKQRKDGTTIICDCHISPLYDEKGQICSYIDVQRDVTRQKEVEAKLQEHKKLIDSILSTMPEGVLVIDGKNRVLLANKALHKIFHLNNRSLKNNLLNEIFPLDRFYDLHKAVKCGETEKNTLEFRYQVQGLEKIIYCVIVKMDGERTLLTFSDVSREREEEEKLYLTDRLASIGEMAAGLAHELNNPLTGILALSQMLTNSNVPEEHKEDLDCIYSEAKRAAGIVKNVLLFARSKTEENGQSSVNEVVKDALRLREYEERTSNITVVTNLEENLPDIPIDNGQLQQVFLNIISNAEAAIKEVNRPGIITVSTQRVNNHINIMFTDNGCGIKKQIIPRIFDPFFTTKEIGKGTGLGLSICYSIIVKHGGKISVKSQVNEGTTFTIRIPIVM